MAIKLTLVDTETSEVLGSIDDLQDYDLSKPMVKADLAIDLDFFISQWRDAQENRALERAIGRKL